MERLRARESGLTSSEVADRLARFGPNTLPERIGDSRLRILGRQFRSPLIYILMLAAILSSVVGEFVDAATIVVILLINAGIGFIQEWRSAEAIRALHRMLNPSARVLRDGGARQIDASDLVPGDICLLEAGTRIPADIRLISQSSFSVDEAALTGESAPVEKTTASLDETTEISSRSNMAFMGTLAANGWASGVVVETGTNTEFGLISELTREVQEEPAPVQRRLDRMARQLGLLAGGVALLVILIAVMQRRELLEVLLVGVSLAVAAIPEGLPAVVTIGLALGVRQMARKKVIVRHLAAVEGLGSVNIIASDKTGTFTRNEMTVTKILADGTVFEVSGTGYVPEGSFSVNEEPVNPAESPALAALLEAGILASHASLQEQDGVFSILGDPTEGAVVVAARKAGITPDDASPQTEFSFDSARMRMTVVHDTPDGLIAFMKGAPEVVLERCNRILSDGAEKPMTESERSRIHEQFTDMGETGLRTIAFARRECTTSDVESADAVERDMVFLGSVGMMDPPRPEVSQAVDAAHHAGIEVYMITGDAASTAKVIAGTVGLENQLVVTGQQLSAMDDDDLLAALHRARVFARVSPADKLRIVSLLQQKGLSVAVTGDGVNDAPALRKADVGVAMGLKGTDVAKAAAGTVITDDNFASIVSGIEEGRRQGDNIRKFVRYLLSSNIGEVVAVVTALIVGGPFILLPVQILWMNLVTDGPTGLAISAEKAEGDVMKRTPEQVRSGILTRRAWLILGVTGLYIGFVGYLLFQTALDDGATEERARTLALTSLIILQKFNALNYRTLRHPLWNSGYFTNRPLILAIAMTVGVHAVAIYTPGLSAALGMESLSPWDWAVMVALGLPLLLVGEASKWFARKRTELNAA